MEVNKSIFRAYDIRGVMDQTLDAEIAYQIGRGFAEEAIIRQDVQTPEIAVARDGRISSPELHQALCDGLSDSGAIVIDCGIGPTPMLYFAVFHLDCDAGIMITGSHNPKDHNGFKMMMGKKSFFDEDITDLYNRIIAKDYSDRDGIIKQVEIQGDYIARILDGLELQNKTIIWDSGNGATGDIIESLTSIIPGNHIKLFTKLDGNFPNHHPDPTVEKNLEDLKQAMTEHDADIGFAFDGDGDRLGVVNKDGVTIAGDHLLAIFAHDILQDNKDAQIIADVKVSNSVFDYIEEQGGQPVIWKTGHSHIKNKLHDLSSPFAGEMSGHIFFNDKYYGYDDGVYSALRLLEMISKDPNAIDNVLSSLTPMHSTPELRIECDEAIKFPAMDKICAKFKDNDNANLIDGVRVTTDKGWWLIRASNTQAVIVLRCEAKTLGDLELLKQEVVEILGNVGIEAQL